MDNQSRDNFDRIMRLEPAALTPGDIDFVNARESYLTPDQRERLSEVLGDAPKAAKAKKYSDK